MSLKRKTERSEKYLNWIRGTVCIICLKTPPEAHHWTQDGHGGKGIKTSDYRAIPLCFEHHKELHDHGKHTFANKYSIDIESVIERLNSIWNALNADTDA